MRHVISLVLIVLMITPHVGVSAKPLLDGSVEFLVKTENLANTTKDISLALMALVAAHEKVDDDLTNNITRLVDSLISRQNYDGGWGYFTGSTSDVVDTSYAVIALNKALALYKKGTSKYLEISRSVDSGVEFILDAYSGKGWGYVRGTAPEFYPTVMAVWALGEKGFKANHPYIKNALIYLENTKSYEMDEYRALALKILAFRSVGYQVNRELIEKVKMILNSENLTVSDRAFLTYVLVTYEGINFETARALLILESIKQGEYMFYWTDKPSIFAPTHIFDASSYATLSYALVSDKLSEKMENPFRTSCSALKELQNPDGGWGYRDGFPSSEKATYYALKALKLCYFRDPSIERGLDWVKSKYEKDKLIMKESHEIYPPYVYTLLTLLEFNILNEIEKAENIELIKSIKMDTGKWGNFLGPQPYDTALAIKSLLALGVSPDDADIQKAKEWLLSLSKTGWGTYVGTGFYPHMLPPEVSVTLEVLEALAPVSTKEELESHLEWLIEQRAEEGGWANIKEHYLFGILQYKEKPTVELTIRTVELLAKFGYDYRQEILNWLMGKEHDGLWGNTIVDSALAIMFLSQCNLIPRINLYDVIRLIPEQKFYLVYTDDMNLTAQQVKASIDKLFETNITVEKFQGFENASYIVLADFEDFNIGDYNPYVKLKVKNERIYINGKEYETKNTVVLIPGKIDTGYVLFVFYNKGLDDVVIKLFDSGLVKYLKGNALVVVYEDKNQNGVVDLDELTVGFLR